LVNIITHAASKQRVASTPQWLNIKKSMSQYASYIAMFCTLYSSISKEQLEESISAIHSTIMGNKESSFVKHAPYILYVKAITPKF